MYIDLHSQLRYLNKSILMFLIFARIIHTSCANQQLFSSSLPLSLPACPPAKPVN